MKKMTESRMLFQSREDPCSPGRRLKRHRRDVVQNRCLAFLHCLLFLGYAVFAANCLGDGLVIFSGLWIVIPITLAWFVSGDVYDFVRDRIEQRVYCPRYDKASQPRPKVEPENENSALRFLIYLTVTPVLPMALIMVFTHFGLCSQKPFVDNFLAPLLNPWLLAAKLVLVLGVTRLHYRCAFPTSVRTFLLPFRRLPSPDVH
jgi:hypothetical protein